MSALRLDPQANENAEAALERARDTKPGPVLIVGGGIGGLATALALAQQGVPSHVLERRGAFNEEGAGIQIGPNGTRILQRLGLTDALYPYVGVPDALSVRDGRTGGEIASLPLGRWMAMRHGTPHWTLHRKDLHAALANAVRAEPLIAVSLDFDASEVAIDAAHVAVAASDGVAWTGRALIAADGIWSTLRTMLIDPAKPRFSGKCAVRSVVPVDLLPADFERNETTIWLSPDAHVVCYPVSGGTELAVIVVFEDQHESTDWSAPVPPSWVQRSMSTSADDVQTLLLAAPSWKRWALHTLPAPKRWTRGPVALLGDAAHPVLPFFAAGAVMALEDAVVVADALAKNTSDVTTALRRYERVRRARVMRVARASLKNGSIYHSSGVTARTRNFVLRNTRPERLMSRYDWLYGWKSD